MKTNKHAAMVIEWALTNKPVQVLAYGIWQDCPYPSWRDEFEYRFMPNVIKSRRYIFLLDGEYQVSVASNDEEVVFAEEADYFVRWIDSEFVEHQV